MQSSDLWAVQHTEEKKNYETILAVHTNETHIALDAIQSFPFHLAHPNRTCHVCMCGELYFVMSIHKYPIKQIEGLRIGIHLRKIKWQ